MSVWETVRRFVKTRMKTNSKSNSEKKMAHFLENQLIASTSI